MTYPSSTPVLTALTLSITASITSRTKAKGYEILALVKAGEMEIPSQEELIALLPTLEIVYTETV